MDVRITDLASMANQQTRASKSAEMREKYGENTIVLFKVGNWYVAYNESADALVKATGIVLDRRAGIRIAEFPKKAEDTYFPRCVREGYKLAILENE